MKFSSVSAVAAFLAVQQVSASVSHFTIKLFQDVVLIKISGIPKAVSLAQATVTTNVLALSKVAGIGPG